MAYIGLVTLVVRDYDEAIDFYVRAAGFQLVEDTRLSEQKRWVVVAPPGTRESGLLLAQAASAGQRERIGDQTGGRVCLFLNTAEFNRDYERLRAAGSGSPSRLVRRPTAPSPFSKTSTAIAGIRSSQPDIAQMPSDPARLALAGESHRDGQATAETSSCRDTSNACATNSRKWITRICRVPERGEACAHRRAAWGPWHVLHPDSIAERFGPAGREQARTR